MCTCVFHVCTLVEPAGHQFSAGDQRVRVQTYQTESVFGCSCRKLFILPADQQRSTFPTLAGECCLQISLVWYECRGTNQCGKEALYYKSEQWSSFTFYHQHCCRYVKHAIGMFSHISNTLGMSSVTAAIKFLHNLL